MATIQNLLKDKTFQISMTATIVFLVVAFPPLFSIVDKLLATVLGTMLAGLAIYKREMSQLFKELEA